MIVEVLDTSHDTLLQLPVTRVPERTKESNSSYNRLN